MIIVAGEADWQGRVLALLEASGYVREDLLVNLHAKGMFPTASAAGQSDLHSWTIERTRFEIDDFSAEMDKTPTSGNEWRARIAHRREMGGEKWYIHDFRPLWFLKSFIAEAKEVRIIALFSTDEDDYHQSISRFLEARLPASLPVLKLRKPPSKAQLEKFLAMPIEENPPAEKE